MASRKLTGFIILNEIANFKGTPDKLKENLETRFPEIKAKSFKRQINEAISRSQYSFSNHDLSSIIQRSHSLEY